MRDRLRQLAPGLVAGASDNRPWLAAAGRVTTAVVAGVSLLYLWSLIGR